MRLHSNGWVARNPFAVMMLRDYFYFGNLWENKLWSNVEKMLMLKLVFCKIFYFKKYTPKPKKKNRCEPPYT